MKKFNKTIKIYRTDVEKMKNAIELRMAQVWDIYYYHLHIEEYYIKYYPEEYAGEYFSPMEIWEEICRTNYLCGKADALLANESFDFIHVDADEWFSEWDFEEYIEDGLTDKYYMLPDSDEVNEIFQNMKVNYKFTVEDLFGIYRFHPLGTNTVVA